MSGFAHRCTAGLLLLLAAGSVSAEQTRWTLGADAWAQPRDGLSVVRMAPLPDVIAAWSRQTGQRLVLRYPGGEEGLLWAHELRGWLVALGIPLADQELVAGSAQADQIEIELKR